MTALEMTANEPDVDYPAQWNELQDQLTRARYIAACQSTYLVRVATVAWVIAAGTYLYACLQLFFTHWAAVPALWWGLIVASQALTYPGLVKGPYQRFLYRKARSIEQKLERVWQASLASRPPTAPKRCVP